jgi:hypothetical protein
MARQRRNIAAYLNHNGLFETGQTLALTVPDIGALKFMSTYRLTTQFTRGTAMSLRFLSTRLTFDPVAHNVHLAALAGDDLAEVIVSRTVVEQLAGVPNPSKDDAITTVVLHKKELEAAAACAFEKNGTGDRKVVVEMSDLTAAKMPLKKRAY